MTEEEARALLPWYAVGALDPGETSGVESWLERSLELRLELAELRELEEGLAQVETPAPRLRPELEAQVLRRVEAYERGRRGWLARLRALLRRVFL